MMRLIVDSFRRRICRGPITYTIRSLVERHEASDASWAHSIISMQSWWLNRMLTTPAPLQEDDVLFTGTTSAAVQKGVSPSLMRSQNQLYRSSALAISAISILR